MSDSEAAAARARIRIETGGRHPDEALAALPQLYEGTSWATEGTEESYSYRYAAVGDADLTLRTSRMRGRIRGDIPPGPDYVVQWLVSGRATVDAGRDDLRMSIGTPLLFPVHRSFVFDFEDYDQKLVHLRREQVAQVAAERGFMPSGLRFDHAGAPSAGATRLWLDTVGLVSRTLAHGEVNDLLWSELTRMAAVAFLELYPPASPELPAVLLRPGAARLRRAVEYLHEHAHRPVSVEDAARAAGVSVRAMQEQFTRVLGATPVAYLRAIRLERVHEELQRTDPSRTTVGEVARRWGFANLGRFSAQYRARFGLYPTETLRRAG